MTMRWRVLGVVAVSITGGCSTPDETANSDNTCSDEVCLQPPESGFQIRTQGTEIQPGEDVEYCEVTTLPGDPSDAYYVNRLETAMTDHSHHIIVSAAIVDSETEAQLVDGDRVACTGAHQLGPDFVGVTGAQQMYHDDAYPEGVGSVFYGGQKVVVDYHYFNPTSEPVAARAAVNFHTVDAESITHTARGFGFINLGINVAPGAQQAFTESCTFTEDVLVFKLTRHTHQWGRDFDVWYAGGERDGDHIWTSDHYENVDYTFAEPVLMKADEGFRFRCDFVNTTNDTLKFGVKATDEMCILFGAYFTPVESNAAPSQGCLVSGH